MEGTIGEKIFALRKSSGMTQADLGARLNISYQAVSKWERGESCPDFDTLSKIAQIFSVSISYFENTSDEVATASCLNVNELNYNKEILGACKECGKVIYKGDEGQTDPILQCKDCVARLEKVEEQRKKNLRRQHELQLQAEENARVKEKTRIRRTRNTGLIVGGIIACVLLLLTIVVSLGEPDEEVGTIIFGGLILTALSFTYASQLFWDGAVVSCTLGAMRIIGTPGIIFSFDLDGFLFLIAMKILFALLRFLVAIITFLLGVAVAVLISPFTFIPALFRVNRGDSN